MVDLARPPRSHCPINFGLEVFGDGWSLLILRDLLIERKTSFSEFRASAEGIATNVLADRLRRLEAAGLIGREPARTDRRQVTYSATAAGQALLPVLVELVYWGAMHDPETAAPAEFVASYRADRAGLLRDMKNTGRPGSALPQPAAAGGA